MAPRSSRVVASAPEKLPSRYRVQEDRPDRLDQPVYSDEWAAPPPGGKSDYEDDEYDSYDDEPQKAVVDTKSRTDDQEVVDQYFRNMAGFSISKHSVTEQFMARYRKSLHECAWVRVKRAVELAPVRMIEDLLVQIVRPSKKCPTDPIVVNLWSGCIANSGGIKPAEIMDVLASMYAAQHIESSSKDLDQLERYYQTVVDLKYRDDPDELRLEFRKVAIQKHQFIGSRYAQDLFSRALASVQAQAPFALTKFITDNLSSRFDEVTAECWKLDDPELQEAMDKGNPLLEFWLGYCDTSHKLDFQGWQLVASL